MTETLSSRAAVAVPCLVCGAPAEATRCPDCEARSPASRTRLRTRRWGRIRDAYLRTHPICAWPGCYARAVIVDHNIPRDQGGGDAFGNLRGYCRQHHADKTKGDTAA